MSEYVYFVSFQCGEATGRRVVERSAPITSIDDINEIEAELRELLVERRVCITNYIPMDSTIDEE